MSTKLFLVIDGEPDTVYAVIDWDRSGTPLVIPLHHSTYPGARPLSTTRRVQFFTEYRAANMASTSWAAWG